MYSKFFVYSFCLTIYLHAHPHARARIVIFFFKSKYRCLHKSQKKTRSIPTRIREISKHKIEACQIIIVSRRYLSRVHEDESPILSDAYAPRSTNEVATTDSIQPRSAVLTFGGLKFLTLQITSTRKRKSAVYFVCGQSETSPSPLLVRVRCWWSARSKDSSNPLPSLSH